MSALLKPLDNRLFWPAVAIGGLLILAFVLYLQHVRGFAPCSLCIFIRLDVLGLGQQLEAWPAWVMLAGGVFLILRR